MADIVTAVPQPIPRSRRLPLSSRCRFQHASINVLTRSVPAHHHARLHMASIAITGFDRPKAIEVRVVKFGGMMLWLGARVSH
jgi:hypothetical protein